MTDASLASACGLYCAECEYLNKNCGGCNSIAGKPFWTAQYGVEVCPIYNCCVDSKCLEHCGLCNELPCETFTVMRDPSLNDEEAEKSLRDRCTNLKLRKQIGTENWIKQRKSQ